MDHEFAFAAVQRGTVCLGLRVQDLHGLVDPVLSPQPLGFGGHLLGLFVLCGPFARANDFEVAINRLNPARVEPLRSQGLDFLRQLDRALGIALIVERHGRPGDSECVLVSLLARCRLG